MRLEAHAGNVRGVVTAYEESRIYLADIEAEPSPATACCSTSCGFDAWADAVQELTGTADAVIVHPPGFAMAAAASNITRSSMAWSPWVVMVTNVASTNPHACEPGGELAQRLVERGQEAGTVDLHRVAVDDREMPTPVGELLGLRHKQFADEVRLVARQVASRRTRVAVGRMDSTQCRCRFGS